ncbi:VOC family protein [Mesorhizobium sp. J428]|uniref:VOC family protein n=1 Tax=Mesorhizobium sp. J428 TaxID=2898440 RepID=UPI002150E905|nr:VOC family protein [Mesorhizobium sp. J428]MCR5859966.1 VOC family protein [Mesorhizobium sp. J428]
MTINRRTVLGGAGAALVGGTIAARSETTMSDLPFAADAPTHIGRIGIVARDAAAMSQYYQQVVGLKELANSGGHITLGAGDRPLMEIEQSSAVRPDDPRSAGLYHTAFLLPSRPDLGRWIRHAIENRIRIDGVADHLVSEAIYLTDPEGNGIEIYADRPAESWNWDGKSVRMATDPLDAEGILATAAGAPDWDGAPGNSIIGHVHLRVGDAGAAESFWNKDVGFDTVLNYGGQAVFLSTGGYHHHIGANSWQSRGAGPRDRDRTGLQWVELLNKGPVAERSLFDPWGTEIILRSEA